MKISVMRFLTDGTQVKEMRQVAEDYFATVEKIPSVDERMKMLEETVGKIYEQITSILKKLV